MSYLKVSLVLERRDRRRNLKNRQLYKHKMMDVYILLTSIIAIIFSAYAITHPVIRFILCLGFATVILVQIAKLRNRKNISINTSRHNRTKKIQSICLLNEEGQIIKEWDVFNKIGLIIGKSTKKDEVDIDLSDCTYAALIDAEHALLNFAAGCWYIEDLYSQNGVYLQKPGDEKKYLLSKDSPCQVEINDSVYIGKTKLIFK